MRSPRRLLWAKVVAPLLVLSLTACAPEPEVAPEQEPLSASSNQTLPEAPAPTAFPTDEPTLAAPDGVLDLDEGAPPTYERTWTTGAWPAVAVPPRPMPRLSATCAQLLEAAGLTGVLRALTVQPTLDALAVRQGGATMCSFAQSLPSGTAITTLQLAVDVAVGRSSAAVCSYTESVSVPTACRGTIDVGSGSAVVLVELPPQADPENGRVVAQSLLGAAQTALTNPGSIRPVPAITGSAMGAGAGGCSPSASQIAAFFSQVDSYPDGRDVYGGSTLGSTAIAQQMHQQVATTSCWWWLGWSGVTVTIVPGAGWAVGEPGVLGTPVTVDGADAALRLEREVTSSVSYGGNPPAQQLEITIIASARGSAVIASTLIDPSQRQYWRDRLEGALEAIIATQP